MIKQNTPRLETERLILRRFTEKDLEDLLPIYGDEEVNRFLPWFPLKNLEEARAYLQHVIFPEYEKETAYRYAVEEKATGRVIGYVSLGSFDEEKRTGDLGYGLRRDHWRQGIIPEAAHAVLEQLKRDGFAFITATHDVNNPASGRVMEKLGMTYRRSYDEQWQPKNIPVTFKLYQIDFE